MDTFQIIKEDEILKNMREKYPDYIVFVIRHKPGSRVIARVKNIAELLAKSPNLDGFDKLYGRVIAKYTHDVDYIFESAELAKKIFTQALS